MTNDCKTCPVSTGTHKPAEAVHQIDESQADALRLAAWLLHRGMSGIKQNDIEASNQLRWLHAESLQHKQELAAYRFTVENREARIAELEAELEAIGAGGVEPLRKTVEDGWIQEGPLLYRLTDERRPKNRDEIIVTMANSSRTEEARTRRAGELLDAIRAAAPQAVQAAAPEGWKLVPIKVPDSAFAWVSGGYPAGYKAWDERDTAVVHERAQRAWEAILNGITAPAPAAVAVPDERAAFEAWLGIKPCGAAHDFGWAAWQARAAIAATQPAAQGMAAERLRNLLCRLVEQLKLRHHRSDGNAPGHGHTIPGVWDKGNGELAGQKCAWCEVWQEALEVHAAAQAKQGGA